MDLIDKYLGEKKKKKVVMDKEKADQKKALRIPTSPKGGELFKDKSKYSRNKKHKQSY